jgi:hypothetical protein
MLDYLTKITNFIDFPQFKIDKKLFIILLQMLSHWYR